TDNNWSISVAGAAIFTQANIDNLQLDANTLSVTNTGGSLTLDVNSGDAAGEDLIVTSNNLTLLATGALSITPDAALVTAIDLTDSDLTNALSVADNNITGTAYSILATAGDLTLDASANINLDADGGSLLFKDNGVTVATFSNSATDLIIDAAGDDIATSDRLTIGSQIPTTVATLDVRGLSGTTSVASISGATSFASLVVDQSGLGDIFTASKGGATKFSIQNNGTLSFAGTSNVLSTIDSAATLSRNWTLPNESGTICIQGSSNCGFAVGTIYWEQTNGALYAKNTTVDLLVGGTSTSAA